MAKSLIQRIALTGGRDIEKELKALGAEGAAAFEKLRVAAAEATKATTPFGRAVVQVRDDIKVMHKSLKTLGPSMNELGSATAKFGRNMAILGTAIAGAAAGMFLFTKRSTEFVDAQGKAAQATGLAIDEYSKLQFVFEQGDVNAEQFNAAMKRFNTTLDEASRGVGEGAEAFERLGIKVNGADGKVRAASEVIVEIAAKFDAMPDGVTKSALAVELFGRAGAAMIPALNDGADGIQKLIDQAQELGLVLDKEAVDAAERFNDSLNALGRTVNAIRVSVALLFAPAFAESFEAITELLIQNRGAMIEFGQAVADFVVPIVRDLLAIFQGREADVVNTWILDTINFLGQMGEAFRFLADVVSFAFASLEEAINLVLSPLNALFGTDLEARSVIIFGIVAALTGAFRVLGAGVKVVVGLFNVLRTLAGLVTAQIVALGAGVIVLLGTIIQAVQDVFGFVGNFITTTFEDAFGEVGDILADSLKVLTDFVDTVIKMFADVGSAIGEAFSSLFGDADAGDGPEAFAGGGRIRGKGTGTSDSILARVSNGEYIVRAKAVQKYGTGMLDRLNGMRLPKFAMGGIVDSLTSPFTVQHMNLPAFADGGSVGASGRPLTLNIGGETFEGLIADDVVAEKLRRFASGRQMRRAGKTPSWYRS